jgi:hypothetical protein
MQASSLKVTVTNLGNGQKEEFDGKTAADLLPIVANEYGQGNVRSPEGTILTLSSGPLVPGGIYTWTASAGKALPSLHCPHRIPNAVRKPSPLHAQLISNAHGPACAHMHACAQFHTLHVHTSPQALVNTQPHPLFCCPCMHVVSEVSSGAGLQACGKCKGTGSC